MNFHNPEITAKLHERGLKSTPLRLSLMTLFQETHSPLSVEEMEKKLGHIEYDPASLFRCLKKFTEAELICVVDLGEGFLRYEAICQVHHHHHHVMCNSCKKIETIPFCIPKEIESHLKKTGYSHLTHRMDFFGLCRSCRP